MPNYDKLSRAYRTHPKTEPELTLGQSTRHVHPHCGSQVDPLCRRVT